MHSIIIYQFLSLIIKIKSCAIQFYFKIQQYDCIYLYFYINPFVILLYLYLIDRYLNYTLLMTEEIIDFTQSTKRIIVNPIIPLGVLDIYCRTEYRVQGTILGKIYSGYIQVIQFIPLNTQNLKIDWPEHQKRVEAVLTIYPNLQILGAVITDINSQNLEIPTLHTLYVANKQSNFKAQGILLSPLILSIGTDLSNGQFIMDAYTYNPSYKLCTDIFGISTFQRWNVKISFGNSNIQQLSPIYTGLKDQQEFLPMQNVKDIITNLIKNLKIISEHIKRIIKKQQPSNNSLGVSLKKILSFNNLSKQEINNYSKKNTSDLKLIVYLSSVINTHSILAQKLNKLG